MWAHIHSLARELELWLSLAANTWLVLRVGMFLIRNIRSIEALIVASVLIAGSLGAMSVSAMIIALFDRAAISWYYNFAYASISVSIFGIALIAVARLLFAVREAASSRG